MISLETKFDVASLLVKVNVRVASLEVAPLETALPLPFTAVIATDGESWSFSVTVLLLCDVEDSFPYAS